MNLEDKRRRNRSGHHRLITRNMTSHVQTVVSIRAEVTTQADDVILNSGKSDLSVQINLTEKDDDYVGGRGLLVRSTWSSTGTCL